MKCTITFRNLEHTNSLDQKIKEKSKKVNMHLGNNAEIEWVCWVEDKSQIAEVKVHDGRRNFLAKAESNSLYKTMDQVINKLTNQIAHQH